MKSIHREFVVSAANEHVWDYLLKADNWPKWASHVRQVKISPLGEVTPGSVTSVTLNSGFRLKLEVNRYSHRRRWQWFGRFLWFVFDEDHRLEADGDGRTRITWSVDVEGHGARIIAPFVARVYGRQVDHAIDNLVAEFQHVS